MPDPTPTACAAPQYRELLLERLTLPAQDEPACLQHLPDRRVQLRLVLPVLGLEFEDRDLHSGRCTSRGTRRVNGSQRRKGWSLGASTMSDQSRSSIASDAATLLNRKNCERPEMRG